jgi:hypothetical protein
MRGDSGAGMAPKFADYFALATLNVGEPRLTRFVGGSTLEGPGFELSVPRAISRDGNLLAADRHLITDDGEPFGELLGWRSAQ